MKTRARIWALTINESANCYKAINDCLGTIIGNGDKWAYIKHDKDVEIDVDTGEEKPKKEHIHLLLAFKNARSFSSIQKAFNGAHIETAIGESAYANYLLHNGKPNKYHYEAEQVQSNNRPWFLSLLTARAKETFIEDKLPYYILVEGMDSYLKMCMRFGAKQLPHTIDFKMKTIKLDFENLTPEERTKVTKQLIDDYALDDLPF